MRPKETYTKEEYNKLKTEISNLKMQLRITEEKLGQEKYINSLLQQRDNGKSYNEIRHIIDDGLKKHEFKELFIKYPYYKELKDCVDMGITDIKQLIKLTGMSKSSIYRALHDMQLFPLKSIDVSNIRLNI
jgi:hypothetical protein